MVADYVICESFEAEWKKFGSNDHQEEKENSPPNGLKYRTIFDVIRTGTLAAVEFLVDRYGIKILCERDENGHTAAHWACLEGHFNIIEYMIMKGAPINLPSRSQVGAYPIHWACVRGHVPVVDLLIQAGVPKDICDRSGCSPLITACQNGSSHLAGYLLGSGVNKLICDNNGDTALHWAAYKGYPDLIRLLIYSGFDPKQKDNYGYTPLHLAALRGNFVSVKDLCEKDKVEIEVKDQKGRTPMQLAKAQGYGDIEQFLKHELRKRRSIFIHFDIWQLIFVSPGHSKFPVLFFLGSLFLWGYPMYILRCVPLTWNELPTIHYFFICTNIVMWISLVTAHNADPGFLPLNTYEYHRTIRQMASLEKWHEKRSPVSRLCHTCRTVRPLRAKHCRICNRCVQHFDHHCPYIYNCVGLNNRTWFLAFSLTIALNCTVTVGFAVACVWKEGWQYTYVVGLLEALLFCCFGWMLSGSTLLYAAYNLTMNEAFNYRRYGYLKDSEGRYRNPFSRGIFENLKEFFHCSRVWDIHDIEKKDEETV